MTEILKGKPVADAVKADVADRALKLKEKGILPLLMILRAGEREDDIAYEKRVIKNCGEVHIDVKTAVFPQDVSPRCIFAGSSRIFRGFRGARHSGAPAAAGADRRRGGGFGGKSPQRYRLYETRKISGKFFTGDTSAVAPCTPEAVIETLKFYGYEIRGKNVTIVNRSLVLGKPLSMLFLNEHATVTVCHSRSENLPEITSKADILVAGVGRPKYFGREYVSSDMTVIDVGINFTEEGMCGDMDFDEVRDIVSAITPVPGGIGTVTSAILLRHLVESAELSIKG